jgi:hypothetical protein
MTITHPDQLYWNTGELPDVHSVPYDCRLMAWFVNDITQEEYERCEPNCSHPDANGDLRRIVMVLPYQNELNALRWCDSSFHPIGYHEKVAYFAWMRKGTPPEAVDFKKEGF